MSKDTKTNRNPCKHHKQQITKKGLALFLFIFGVLTLKSGGSVLFDESALEAAGNILIEVVWFNFLAGFLYILAAYGTWNDYVWNRRLTLLLFAAYLVMMVYFSAHILRGGLYELRTLFALSFRTFVWGAILLGSQMKQRICLSGK